jgi:hypothetical protein
VTELGEVPERAVLDTSVVIGDAIAPIPGVLAISALTLAELHFSVFVARSAEVRAERLRRLSVLQHHFNALPVDEAVAECGALRHDRGRPDGARRPSRPCRDRRTSCASRSP